MYVRFCVLFYCVFCVFCASVLFLCTDFLSILSNLCFVCIGLVACNKTMEWNGMETLTLYSVQLSSVRPMYSLYCFYVLTLYVSVGLRADISEVHRSVCPACCTVKLTLHIADLTFWQMNEWINQIKAKWKSNQVNKYGCQSPVFVPCLLTCSVRLKGNIYWYLFLY